MKNCILYSKIDNSVNFFSILLTIDTQKKASTLKPQLYGITNGILAVFVRNKINLMSLIVTAHS